jgi:hypothetical protein
MAKPSVSAQNLKISDNIRVHGWHCLYVFPIEKGQENFTYSIGFAETYGAPEVLIFSVEREKAHTLLSVCAQLLKEGHTIRPDIEDPEILKGGYKVVFKTIRSECFGEYIGTAERYYKGKPFGAVVMFLPDREHRFPWQAGYNYIPAKEPLSIVQSVK